MVGIPAFQSLIAENVLWRLANSVLGFGRRYLPILESAYIGAVFTLYHVWLETGNILLSSFHINIPLLNLINESKGRILYFWKRGIVCSLLFLKEIDRIAFLFDKLRHFKCEMVALLQLIKL